MPYLKRIYLLALTALTILGLAPTPVMHAQEDAQECPLIVEQALATAGEVCDALGRNQICYGYNMVNATDWEQAELADFGAPGDTVDVMQLATLATAPMDLENDIWGVAVLALQANLPETMPGQNVTFVIFGDAKLQNEVPPEEVAPPSATCTASSAQNVNVRTGPYDSYARLGVLEAYTPVTINGRNAAGDWLRLEFNGQTGWIYGALLRSDCDVDILPVDEAHTYTAPLQAFYLTTGIGKPTCKEAPRDGLLVQAPHNTTVNFLINGIEVSVGSTAFFSVINDTLTSNVIEGTVGFTSGGHTQVAHTGEYISAIAGEAPTVPLPADNSVFNALPVGLLGYEVVPPWMEGVSPEEWDGLWVPCECDVDFACSDNCICDPECNSYTTPGLFCPCDTDYACTPDCLCDPECNLCDCDVNSKCTPGCECDPDCVLCGCDVDYKCTPGSPCDPECIICECDTDWECTPGCACDPECEYGACECDIDDTCTPYCRCDPDCPPCECDIDDTCTPYCRCDPDCPPCECDIDDTCTLYCECDPDCPSCECDIDYKCTPYCECDPDCSLCECDIDYKCTPYCECDPECEVCECDYDWECTPGCGCDPECD